MAISFQMRLRVAVRACRPAWWPSEIDLHRVAAAQLNLTIGIERSPAECQYAFGDMDSLHRVGTDNLHADVFVLPDSRSEYLDLH